jgi:MFS transporter, DHA2 family, multidrug resistance protein
LVQPEKVAWVAFGLEFPQTQQQAIGWIGQQLQAQATFLAYVDAFWVLMVISLMTVPLALALRKVELGAASPMGH